MKKNKLLKCFAIVGFILTSSFAFTSCKDKEEETKVTCTYDGEKFDWTDVKSATSYNVAVEENREEQAKTVNSSELNYDLSGESAKLSINAVDSNGTSLYSSDTPFIFKRLSVFDTPTYDHGIISWKKIPSAEYYLVKVGNGQPQKVENTFFELNPGANNDVCVKPVLDVSKVTDGTYYSYSIPKTYEVVATPMFESFDKASKTFIWNTVKNCGGYYINILKDGVTVAEQGGIGIDATYYNGYSFTNAGMYTVKIAATKNANVNSYDSKYYEKTIIRLAAPQNLRTEDSDGAIVLKWDAVPYATKYKVVLPSGNFAETTNTYYKFIPEIQSNENNYNFKVYSQSTDLYTLDSLEYAEEDVIKLAMVKNIKIQGQKITWDIVDKAQGYIVSIDGTEVNVDKNEYLFDGYVGSHEVKVKANGNKSNIISSDYSTSQTIYKLSTPKNLVISNGVLTWDAVSNASSYKIILTNGNSGASDGSYTSTTNSIVINRNDLRETQTIQVQAIGDGNTIGDSLYSESYQTFVLSTPSVNVTTDGIAWTKVNNATYYTVFIDDHKKNVTGTSLNISEEDISIGIHTVIVVANGDLVHYFDSDESQAISIKLLEKPNVLENSELTGVCWNTITSASNYAVRVDDDTSDIVGQTVRNYDVVFATSGIHTISVRALGDSTQTISSGWTSIQINVQQLMSSKDLTIVKEEDKLLITATEVENAIGYKFKIGGVVYNSDTNVYEYMINNPGDFVISVAAVGTGFKYIDSNYTLEKTITVLNCPTKAEFTQEDDEIYLLSWTPVNKAVSYSVEIKIVYTDGEEKTKVYQVTNCEMKIDVNDVLSISAKIITNGNDTSTFSSNPKDVETIFVKKH